MFLKCASLRRRVAYRLAGKDPPLCELADVARAHATLVHQYCRLFANGFAPRLRLLWGRDYVSFDEWGKANPEMLGMLRRGVFALDLWIFLRVTRKFNRCFFWDC